MKYIVYILVISFLISCETWDDYHTIPNDDSRKNIWESISEKQEFRSFVDLVKEYSLDTIFDQNITYTVFIPSNEAVDSIDFTQTDPVTFLKSHISNTMFLVRNIKNSEKLRTISGKYAVIEPIDGGHLFNRARIINQSNLHSNGIYYSLQGASAVFENLFQYLNKVNPLVADYIRMHDSVYLDMELSRPIEIDEEGRIIYDSVKVSVNLFELAYFPLSYEFRDIRATMVMPTVNQYMIALDAVKSKLGLDSSFEIPMIWQHSVLIPFILNQGLFDGALDSEDFDVRKLKNILGDSVIINYKPVNRFECSNGLFYTYDHFTIPDSLFLDGYRLEGESLVTPQGLERFAWKDSRFVRVSSTSSFAPVVQRVTGIASNDSVLFLDFGYRYEGKFTVEFKIENVFPGQYQFIWRSNPRNGGIYSVYINDELQTLSFNVTEFDLANLSGGVVSVTGNQYFYPQSGYNRLDALTMIEQYGDVWIRLEYKGPGTQNNTGLIIDYVELIPYK
jgi:hypothetical protein